MSERTRLWDRIEARLDRFSERERKLLGLMFATFVALFLIASTITIVTKLGGLADSIETQRGALSAMMSQREEYLARAARNERLQELLEDNDLRLSSFIESQARSLRIDPPREFRDNQRPLPSHPGITAFETTAIFSGITILELTDLLEQISSSDELVFIQQIAVEPPRRAQGSGTLEAEVTVVTYRRSNTT